MSDKLRTFASTQASLALAGILLLAGCTGHDKSAALEPVPEIRPGILQGYLDKDAMPDSLTLAPAPPTEDSAAYALDRNINESAMALRGTARWELAHADADLHFPHAAGTFSCALNAPITEQDTPHLYRVLRRTLADAGLSTYAAKNHYQRARPFLVNQQPTCAPEDEEALKKDGSYPSGHSAAGWAWALILSEVAPERGDALLDRGLAFGQSRVICNVHWQSDVIEGRNIASAAFARLQSNAAFRADLEAAKKELAAIRGKGLAPLRDCAAEKEALSIYPPSASWPAGK